MSPGTWTVQFFKLEKKKKLAKKKIKALLQVNKSNWFYKLHFWKMNEILKKKSLDTFPVSTLYIVGSLT